MIFLWISNLLNSPDRSQHQRKLNSLNQVLAIRDSPLVHWGNEWLLYPLTKGIYFKGFESPPHMEHNPLDQRVEMTPFGQGVRETPSSRVFRYAFTQGSDIHSTKAYEYIHTRI